MGTARKKVLVVEDNDHWRKLLAMVVQRSGYDVIQAGNGVEGVERATEALPDLILMDVGMPKMSGDEATAILKAAPATKHIPIVIQTAYSFSGTSAIPGAAEILQKPIEIAQIQRVLARYLELSAPVPAAAGTAPRVSAPA